MYRSFAGRAVVVAAWVLPDLAQVLERISGRARQIDSFGAVPDRQHLCWPAVPDRQHLCWPAFIHREHVINTKPEKPSSSRRVQAIRMLSRLRFRGPPQTLANSELRARLKLRERAERAREGRLEAQQLKLMQMEVW